MNSALKSPSFVFGLVLVIAGSLLLLDKLDILDLHVFRLWPLLLIAAGFFKLMQAVASSGKALGAMLVLGGCVLLAANFGFLRAGVGDLWPLFIIGIGLAALWRAAETQPDGGTPAIREAVVNQWAAFGGIDTRIDAQDFRGGEFVAAFGGHTVDLRNASIRGSQAVVNATVFCGGVELVVPKGWTVITDGVIIFGGIEDKTRTSSEQQPTADAKCLMVHGVGMFGGVEVKNPKD